MTQGKAEEGKGEGGPGGVSSRSPLGTVIRDPGNASASRSRKGDRELEAYWVELCERQKHWCCRMLFNTNVGVGFWFFFFSICSLLPLLVVVSSFILRGGRVGMNCYSHLQTGRSVQSGGPHQKAWVSPCGFFEPGAYFPWPTLLLL